MFEKTRSFFKTIFSHLSIVIIGIIIIIIAYLIGSYMSERKALPISELNFNDIKVAYVGDTKEAFLINRKTNVTIVVLDEKVTDAIQVCVAADKSRSYTEITTPTPGRKK